MSQALVLLIAIFKAAPIIERFWERLVIAYLLLKETQEKKKFKEEILKAFQNQDQRGLENENYSGKYSGHGTLRDSIPGVHKSKES